MTIDEEINEYIELSCIYENLNMHTKNDPSGCGCIPDQQTATRYHKIGLANKHRMITRISRNGVNQLHMTNESSNQSISHEITYVGPPPKPDCFCMDQICKFHYSELQNLILYLFQNIFKTEEV